MNKLFITSIIVSLIFSACSKNNINEEPILNVPVNLTINMSLPQFEHLLQQNTFIYQEGGVKGIVIVHYTDDNFYALDRSCSYQPNNSCSKIEVDSSLMIFRCGESKLGGFQKCCDSKFLLDGSVFSQPATFGLKHYPVFRSGNVLEIKN